MTPRTRFSSLHLVRIRYASVTRGWARAVSPAGRRRALLATSYSLLLVSCDSPFAPDQAAVQRLETTPLVATITVGETRQIAVRVLDKAGKTLTNRQLFWSTQNPTIATVSQTGVVIGVAQGATQVAVSAGGKSALVPVTVNPRPVSLVRVTPSTASIVAGTTTPLSAQALDAGGATVTGRAVIWGTSAAAIASVTSTGVVSAISAGTANITATVDAVVGASVVTVLPVPVASILLLPVSGALIVGEQLQLLATPRDASGAALPGRTITWSSNAPANASVSSTGVVTALSRGNATITATSEGKSATARMVVSLVPIDTLSITPRSSTLAAGQAVQLVARVVDSTGALLTGRVVTWDTDQPTIATVSTGGLVTALTTGRATITATVEGKSATATVNVTPVPVASVSIAPTSATILLGQKQQFVATTRDAANNVLPGRSITWISGAPSVATVNQNGLVSAVGAGSALIFAASEGVSSSVSVTISTVGVAQVRMAPVSGSVEQGKTLQLTATPLDAAGTPITGRTIAWNSAAPSVASVSSTGLVTGVTAGSANITATVDGVIGTAALTVTAVPVASASIVPASPTLVVGTTQQLTALLADVNGAPLSPIGRNIGWAVANSTIASISASGLVTAIASGSTVVQATVEGVIAQTTVTVTSVPVANVTLAPASASLNVGQTQAVTATAKDASGNTLTGRPVTWSSNAPAVATVSTSNATASNTITAVGTGTATISATVGGVQGVATVTVSSVPIATITVAPSPGTVEELKTTQLTATPKDAAGTTLTGRTLLWQSSNNAIASVSQAGLVTANVPGSVTITASAPGQGTGGSTPAGTSTVTVTFAAVATASIAPSNPSVTVGQMTQPSVTLVSSGGQTLAATGRTVTWSLVTTPAGAATINTSTGQITGVAAGTGTITVTASSPGQLTPVTATAALSISTVQIARVTFLPFVGTLHIGSTYARVVQAQAFDASNNVLPGRLIAWASENSNISVSSSSTTSGQVTITGNLSPATVMVVATAQGGSGPVADTINVVTDYVPIAAGSTVTLAAGQADSVVNALGQSRNYTATPRDSAGTTITGAALGGRAPVWSAGANASVTGIGASATVTPSALGSATITADYTTTAPTAVLKIIVPARNVLLTFSSDSVLIGGSATVTASVVDAANGAIPGRVVHLSSGSTSIASLASTTGVSTISTSYLGASAPAGRNTATILATSQLDSASATSGFTPASRTAIVLAPATTVTVTTSPADSIFVAATTQASAVLKDALNNTLVNRSVIWTTGSGMIATVDAGGLVTGGAAGSTSVSASPVLGGGVGSRTLLVQERVFTVALVAGDSSIFVAQTQPTTVTLKDQFNNTLTGRVVSYNATPSGVVTISGAGAITAIAAGTTSITATSEGKTSSAIPFVVSLVPVATVTASATPPPNVYPTHTFPATVQAFDASSNLLGLSQRTIVWSTNNAAVATVAAGGAGSAAITAVGVGTTTISVTVDGVTVTTPITVTVNLVPVASIVVSPSTASQQVGVTAFAFTATARDSIGGTLSGRSVTWSTSNAAKATVNASNGAVTAIDSSAAVTITATATAPFVGGSPPAGNAALTVTLMPILSVTLTPSTATVAAAATQNITADVVAAGSIPLQGRACTVVSSNTAAATVTPASGVTDAAGKLALVVTGVATGSATITVTCDPGTPGAKSGTATITVP